MPTTPIVNALRIRVNVGEKRVSYTYNNVKPTVDDEDVWAVGDKLKDLLPGTFEDIQLVEVSELDYA